MSAAFLTRTAILITIASTAFACSSDPESSGSGGSGGDPGSGGAGGAGGGVPHADLLSCGLVPSCEEVVFHTSPQPFSAHECASTFAEGTSIGVLLHLWDPDGHYKLESLVITLGDGTALVQSRERQCTTDCPAWEPVSSQQICTIAPAEGTPFGPSPQQIAECPEGDESCRIYSWAILDDCHDVEDRSCDDVSALIAAE
jgi:hypothetical protein